MVMPKRCWNCKSTILRRSHLEAHKWKCKKCGYLHDSRGQAEIIRYTIDRKKSIL